MMKTTESFTKKKSHTESGLNVEYNCSRSLLERVFNLANFAVDDSTALAEDGLAGATRCVLPKTAQIVVFAVLADIHDRIALKFSNNLPHVLRRVGVVRDLLETGTQETSGA